MKKFVSLILTITILLSLGITAYAKVGDIVGVAYHTDIVSYINNYAIPSYAANGTSVIVAEDLRNFGFNVTWKPESRSLIIERNLSTQPKEMAFSKTGAPTSKFADLLATDIKVIAGGKKITSYAINGYTLIPLEELTMFGNVTYDNTTRALKFRIDGLRARNTLQQVAQYNKQSNTSQQVTQYSKQNNTTLTAEIPIATLSQILDNINDGLDSFNAFLRTNSKSSLRVSINSFYNAYTLCGDYSNAQSLKNILWKAYKACDYATSHNSKVDIIATGYTLINYTKQATTLISEMVNLR